MVFWQISNVRALNFEKCESVLKNCTKQSRLWLAFGEDTAQLLNSLVPRHLHIRRYYFWPWKSSSMFNNGGRITTLNLLMIWKEYLAKIRNSDKCKIFDFDYLTHFYNCLKKCKQSQTTGQLFVSYFGFVQNQKVCVGQPATFQTLAGVNYFISKRFQRANRNCTAHRKSMQTIADIKGEFWTGNNGW